MQFWPTTKCTGTNPSNLKAAKNKICLLLAYMSHAKTVLSPVREQLSCPLREKRGFTVWQAAESDLQLIVRQLIQKLPLNKEIACAFVGINNSDVLLVLPQPQSRAPNKPACLASGCMCWTMKLIVEALLIHKAEKTFAMRIAWGLPV